MTAPPFRRRMRRAVAALLVAALPPATAAAAEDSTPRVSVTVAPDAPVVAGTPVDVSVTVLVPTWMPKPPVWPDLEIADAITRLPDRATHPVTERVGATTWSGLVRRWQIIPQGAATYDLGAAEVAITYADPATSAPVAATLPIPDIRFSATIPAGAAGMTPFLPASALTLTGSTAGLPDRPKPGDAFTLTLATTADGPPAMMLPPLASRLPTLPGLRAYPREPALDDGPPATRTEAVTYVIEAPGHFVLPALTLEWWNTAAGTREAAATAPVVVDVPFPPGWHAAGDPASHGRWLVLGAAALVLSAAALLLRRHPYRPRPPSEAARFRALADAALSGTPATIRAALATWEATLPHAVDRTAIEAALRPLDQLRYGASPPAIPEAEARQSLAKTIAATREAARASMATATQPLPPLNPALG